MRLYSKNSLIKPPEQGSVVYSFPEGFFESIVIDRPNRFLVNVNTKKGPLKCHIHDPGRLKELIFEGNRVLVRPTNGIKTQNSITAALDSGEWILTDTRVHSQVASVFLPEKVEREVTIGNHRLDFRFNNTLIEVKGCTMLKNGIATFPDAPTKRGKEHLQLLRSHSENGGKSLIIILVFRANASSFEPNNVTDPGFSKEFVSAIRGGVEYFIPRFSFENGSVVYRGQIDLSENYVGQIQKQI